MESNEAMAVNNIWSYDGGYQGTYPYSYTYTSPNIVSYVSGKIELTYTEIERLRAAAKAEPAVAAILKKFVPFISVKVDF